MSGESGLTPAQLLEKIQPELLTLVLQLSKELQTVTSARASCCGLRDAAAAATGGLRALEGLLPPEAWGAFPCATRCTAVQGSSLSLSSSSSSYLSNLLQTLASLPARLEHLSIGPARTSSAWCAEGPQALARQLLAAACTDSLRSLQCAPAISTHAAAAIMRGLAGLTELQLTLTPSRLQEQQQQQGQQQQGQQQQGQQQQGQQAGQQAAAAWRPAAQLLQLQQCKLSAVPCWPAMTPAAQALQIDLSGISSASKLRQLTITGPAHISDMSALGALSSMQRLTIEQQPSLAPAAAAGLRELQELQLLRLPKADCCAAAWHALTSLPKLETIELCSVCIDEHAPAAVAVTKLVGQQAGGSVKLHLQQPAALLPGCLARQLPQLQELSATSSNVAKLAAALGGLTSLRRLRATARGDAGRRWPGGLLAQLPQLQALDLTVAQQDLGDLLADVAQCGGLTELRVMGGPSDEGAVAEVAGLATLAAGPCGASLQVLTLWQGAVAAGEAVEVLAGRMPALRSALLQLRFPKAVVSREGAERHVGRVIRSSCAEAGAAAGCGAGSGRWAVQVSAWYCGQGRAYLVRR